jgi:transposase-like protein
MTYRTRPREIRELRRKNRELEQTVEILKAATSFFAREHNPLRPRHDLNHIRRPLAGRARTIDY